MLAIIDRTMKFNSYF